MLEQPLLDGKGSGFPPLHETAYPVLGHRPMTGNYERNRVGTAGIGYGTRARTYLSSQLRVCEGGTNRYHLQRVPDPSLKSGTLHSHWNMQWDFGIG
jgi:hypothetical protein